MLTTPAAEFRAKIRSCLQCGVCSTSLRALQLKARIEPGFAVSNIHQSSTPPQRSKAYQHTVHTTSSEILFDRKIEFALIFTILAKPGLIKFLISSACSTIVLLIAINHAAISYRGVIFRISISFSKQRVYFGECFYTHHKTLGKP